MASWTLNQSSPPRIQVRSKISFGPGSKQNRVVGINVHVREREAERRRAADHLTLGVVLRAVARALELVLSLVPGDDATQVRAHRVQTKVSERPILLDDQVRGVTLQALRERVVARQVRLEPRRLLDVVTVRILRGLTGTTATGAVVRISNTQSVTYSRSRRRRRVIYYYGRGASSCTKRANSDHHTTTSGWV